MIYKYTEVKLYKRKYKKKKMLKCILRISKLKTQLN